MARKQIQSVMKRWCDEIVSESLLRRTAVNPSWEVVQLKMIEQHEFLIKIYFPNSQLL